MFKFLMEESEEYFWLLEKRPEIGEDSTISSKGDIYTVPYRPPSVAKFHKVIVDTNGD